MKNLRTWLFARSKTSPLPMCWRSGFSKRLSAFMLTSETPPAGLSRTRV